MGTHPIFESDFDCLTELSDNMGEAVPLGKVSEIVTDTKLILSGSKATDLSASSLKHARMYSGPNKPDILSVPPRKLIKREWTSDGPNEDFDHYILIVPKKQKFSRTELDENGQPKKKSKKLILMSSEYHSLHPIRESLVDDLSTTEVTSYKDLKTQVSSTFGSS